MRTLIILGAIGIALLILAQWFIRTPPHKVVNMVKKVGLFVVGALLILAVLTGRAPWLFAVIGGALPFMHRLATAWKTIKFFKSFQNRQQGARPKDGHTGDTGVSRIATRFLSMELDHHSGAITGSVLTGAYAGRNLQDMDFACLLDLLHTCQGSRDQDSVRLLESYLQRQHVEAWEQYCAAGHREDAHHAGASGAMNREEALSLLGLTADATHSDISAAHKRLIQRLHPDRGGTDYLAAKINQAKDVLLKKPA